MSSLLPKVLVIASTPFSKTKNNGKTLSSFFESYDKSLIAQFSFSGGDANPDVCDSYFFLTNNDMLKGKQGNAYQANEILSSSNNEKNSKQSILRRFFHIFSQARNPLAIWVKNKLWRKADYTKAFEWIDEFNPDIVFFQGFSKSYGYEFALNVCKSRKLPLILELTDDYTYRFSPLSIVEKINHAKYMKLFTEAITYAHKTIVISELMKEEYQARFGGDMLVMMNTITATSSVSDCNRAESDYVYAGNLLLNRWKVLYNLGKALEIVKPDARLNIYTPDIPPKNILKALSTVKSIHLGGRLTKEELECRLKKCEYVVHVEAFDKKNRKITRLSMSTKIPEYVASGAKILAIGPSDVASMRCLSSNNLGICINNPSVKVIADELSNYDTDCDFSKNSAKFIESCAAASNGDKIIEILTDAVNRRKGSN